MNDVSDRIHPQPGDCNIVDFVEVGGVMLILFGGRRGLWNLS